MNGPLLLTVEEAAQQLRVSPDTIRRLLRDQKIAGVRVGGQWRVPSDTLRAVVLPIGAILNEQVETLKDHEFNGVKIPAHTFGYVLRHSVGTGGCYSNTISVCQTPAYPYGTNMLPAFDLQLNEQNVTWKFIPNDGNSQSLPVPRALLRQLKDMLNEAHQAATGEQKNSIIEHVYSVLGTVLGKDDPSGEDHAIAQAIQAKMEALVKKVFGGS